MSEEIRDKAEAEDDAEGQKVRKRLAEDDAEGSR